MHSKNIFTVLCSQLILASLSFADLNVSQDCDAIKTLYDSKGIGAEPSATSKNDITDTYKKIKQFSSGAGGGSVYLVESYKDKKQYVLKIFPEESFVKPFDKNNELREIYFTCKLTKFPQFPQFFGYGHTTTNQPFDASAGIPKKHFYILLEFIKGKDIFTLSDTDADRNAYFGDAKQAKYILAEVVKALQLARKELPGFAHLDLHPGNIMITGSPTKPGIKIIDFGLSADDKFSRLNETRNYSLVVLKFIQNMLGLTATPGAILKASEIRSNNPESNDDLQFINMMIYTFRNYFANKQKTSTDKAFVDYCNTFLGCLHRLE